MPKKNDAILYTNNACIGCNKCVSVCPTMGANISKEGHDGKKVSISDRCIRCGVCIKNCPQHARVFSDDTEKFFVDLDIGTKIDVLIDPAFFLDFGERAYQILGYLRTRGAGQIYDVSFGGDIAVWAHVNYLKGHGAEKGKCREFVANSCTTLVNYAQKYNPEILDYIVPVKTPAACMATYVRKKLGNRGKLAYITPCVAQLGNKASSDELDRIDYYISFSHLLESIKNVDLAPYYQGADITTDGFGKLISFSSGFRDAVAMCFPPTTLTVHYTLLNGEVSKGIEDFLALSRCETKPVLVTASNCAIGCVGGTAVSLGNVNYSELMETYGRTYAEVASNIGEGLGWQEISGKLEEKFKDLDLNDYSCFFLDVYKQPFRVPEKIIEKIFLDMYKNTPAKRTMNCFSCGYKTCRDFAVAVANGYAQVEDCVHYLHDDLIEKTFHDNDYGMYNGQGFFREIGKTIAKHPQREYVICMGNINKLRIINELYTKPVGDQVLKTVGRYLVNFSHGRAVCARMGGNVFALFMENTPENMKSFRSSEYIDCGHLGIDFHVSIRWGMCFFTPTNSSTPSPHQAANLASVAYDWTTDRSRNTFILFNEEMNRKMTSEVSVTKQMHIAKKNGEFVLYLQPQYDHKTRKIMGAEVLCRWIKQDGTIVSPGDFIPIFEKNGFIKELDRYVWENSFKLMSKWRFEKIPHVPISINISRFSIVDPEIVEFFARLLNTYRIDPGQIRLELTESAYINDEGVMTERIAELKKMGFKISMDDFGSGYSSLNTLKDMEMDEVKLDMGFLNGKENSERGMKIVSYIIDMAHSLNLVTVAEGVETKEQADELTEKGCDIIQGYYYARPMPVRNFEALLASTEGE